MDTRFTDVMLHEGTDSNWASVREILTNLRSVYFSLAQNEKMDLRFLAYNRPDENWSRVKIIEKWDAQRLFFLDDSPPAPHVLSSMTTKNPDWNRKIYIHVYGNFTYDLRAWTDAEPFIIGKPLLLMCASERQKKHVSSFVAEESLRVVPFPVDQNIFFYRSEIRKELRESLGVQPNDYLLVYAGRFSLQKNILPLLKEFERWLKTDWGGKLHIALAGEFDSLSAPMLKFDYPEGLFYTDVEQFLRSLPYSCRRRIHFMGWQTHEELARLYSAGDGFISLSTHMDEDFGMAPKAANFCGLPSLLSDWGGFWTDFDGGQYNSFFPIHFSEKGLLFRQDEVDQILHHRIIERLGEKQRKDLSQKAVSAFGFNAIEKKIADILKEKEIPPFSGFNWRSGAFAFHFKKRKIERFDDDSVFKEFYGCYAGK